ncbi:MAG TPA: CPBP family intramembrane glutamic endopeptidase [Bacilli bacterium]|nr:CPBP family intramembrane glutamic endopeptidase [Bacilli bacterium]
MDYEFKPFHSEGEDEQFSEENVRKEKRLEVTLALLGTVGLNLLVIVLLVPLLQLIALKNPDRALYFQNVWSNFLIYGIVFTIMVLILHFQKFLKPLIKEFTKPSAYLWGFVFGIVVILAQIMYGIFTETVFGDIPVNENQEGVVNIIKMNPIVAFIWIPFIGPLVEELTYRRGLFSRLRRINFPVAIVVTSLLFGLVHFSIPFTDTNQIDLVLLRYELINLPGYIISGAIFCYTYEKYGFAASSLAHIFNNLFAFAVTFLV